MPHLFSQTKASKIKPQTEKDLRLSLVVPTYNVEPYIDRFLTSVFTQSSFLKSFEVIIVDDGSTDGTAEIVKSWQARYPDFIRYVYQDNAGPAAARNTGLKLAQGTWVTFPDPDDFLDVDNFRKMLKETEFEHEKPLIAVVAHLVLYFEERNQFSDTHPLKYRFGKQTIRKRTQALNDHMQLSSATCWFHRPTIVKHKVNFDERVVPSFEDAHWVNRLFLFAPDRTVSFVPTAKYYYRKRAAQTSILDGTKHELGWFDDQIAYGSLDLLRTAKKMYGAVPNHIQRVCLYDIFWRFRYLVDNAHHADFLTDAQRLRFHDLVTEVFSFIDVKMIETYNLAGCTEEHKVALLALYKQLKRQTTAVYIRQIDAISGLAQFLYMSGGDDAINVTALVNGKSVVPQLRSCRRADFLGRTYFRQHFFWLSLKDGDEVSFQVKDGTCRIRHGGTDLGATANWLQLRNALTPAAPKVLTTETKRLRDHVIASKQLYRDCLILMDRDDKADDNAEHLYRHLLATGQADNAWFILAADAPDWNRLQAEGFHLLAYGSDDHIGAQMNASLVISSHADQHVLWPVNRAEFADLAHFEFVFLQHGVMINDLSKWLNVKQIRLFATTTATEYSDIAGQAGPYVFTEREVIFSGLPRHDGLLKKAKGTVADTILITPTWRKYLTASSSTLGDRWGKTDGFAQSEFAQQWMALLHSERLRSISQKHGLQIVFAPHPNVAMYLDDMALPAHVNAIDVRDGVSYQDLFARTRVALTDYSSTAMEVAYLDRPVVYFQFDRDQIYKGDHGFQPSSFSFENDGFGPITLTSAQTIEQLDAACSGLEDPQYAQRRKQTFPFRDGKCAARVSDAINRLLSKKLGQAPRYVTQGHTTNTHHAFKTALQTSKPADVLILPTPVHLPGEQPTVRSMNGG